MALDANNRPITGGFYLDSFGFVVHIRARKGGELEYASDLDRGYVTLGEYGKLLLCKLSHPNESAKFIGKVRREAKEGQLTKTAASGGSCPCGGDHAERD